MTPCEKIVFEQVVAVFGSRDLAIEAINSYNPAVKAPWDGPRIDVVSPEQYEQMQKIASDSIRAAKMAKREMWVVEKNNAGRITRLGEFKSEAAAKEYASWYKNASVVRYVPAPRVPKRAKRKETKR